MPERIADPMSYLLSSSPLFSIHRHQFSIDYFKLQASWNPDPHVVQSTKCANASYSQQTNTFTMQPPVAFYHYGTSRSQQFTICAFLVLLLFCFVYPVAKEIQHEVSLSKSSLSIESGPLERTMWGGYMMALFDPIARRDVHTDANTPVKLKKTAATEGEPTDNTTTAGEVFDWWSDPAECQSKKNGLDGPGGDGMYNLFLNLVTTSETSLISTTDYSTCKWKKQKWILTCIAGGLFGFCVVLLALLHCIDCLKHRRVVPHDLKRVMTDQTKGTQQNLAWPGFFDGCSEKDADRSAASSLGQIDEEAGPVKRTSASQERSRAGIFKKGNGSVHNPDYTTIARHPPRIPSLTLPQPALSTVGQMNGLEIKDRRSSFLRSKSVAKAGRAKWGSWL